jgi:hypothetical protein
MICSFRGGGTIRSWALQEFGRVLQDIKDWNLPESVS